MDTNKVKKLAKDLAKDFPRSPRETLAGYVIAARTLDKCRATLAGTPGEYHFDCPLDNMLFGFKGVKGEDFKAQIEQDAGDQEMIDWLNQNGEKKTAEDVDRGTLKTGGRRSIVLPAWRRTSTPADIRHAARSIRVAQPQPERSKQSRSFGARAAPGPKAWHAPSKAPSAPPKAR